MNENQESSESQLLREKILSHDCLRSSLNPQNLAKLPKEVQTELFMMLPSVDQNLSPSSSVLNNVYFNSACQLFLERLAEDNEGSLIEKGVVTRASERRMHRERSKSKLDKKVGKKPVLEENIFGVLNRNDSRVGSVDASQVDTSERNTDTNITNSVKQIRNNKLRLPASSATENTTVIIKLPSSSSYPAPVLPSPTSTHFAVPRLPSPNYKSNFHNSPTNTSSMQSTPSIPSTQSPLTAPTRRTRTLAFKREKLKNTVNLNLKRQKIETIQDLNKNSEKPDGSSLLIKPGFSVPARFADKIINVREIKSELIEQYTILNKKRPNMLNSSLAKSLLEKSIVLKIGTSKIGTSKMRASTIESFTNVDLSDSKKLLTTVASLNTEFDAGLKIHDQINEKNIQKINEKINISESTSSYKSPVSSVNSTDLRASRRLSGRIKREAAEKQKFNFSRLRVHTVKTLPMFGGLTAAMVGLSDNGEEKRDRMDLSDMEVKLKTEAIECTSGNSSPSGIMARVRSSKSTNSTQL